ncbi:sensor histidine kinase [Francisella marina]|uniref:histidine kinase n=1 Tax=Francisella marina TaxID=2249302 RepID=A0ABX5ZHI6_9GAMM|nr:sensor histidine kinase [Francisella marina]QEO57748.1 sensor histidine kinase [Francisella marina]QEO60026.1 sensor histidine kinase [Francisella marina]
MKEEINFTSKARIIRTLGDKLISNEIAAIVELVKNAYDADASKCLINIDPKQDLIVIEDNGHGMSKEDIKTKWIQLGTTNKLKSKFSQSGKRKVLGNKGIGRVAAAKLGSRLDIYSTINTGLNSSESIHLSDIDWDLFSDDVEKISDIKFYLDSFTNGVKSSGTRLEIRKLCNDWTKENLTNLIRELRKLVSPIKIKVNDKECEFKVFLNLDAFNVDEYGFCGHELINGERSLLDVLDSKKGEENLIEAFPILDSCDYTFDGVFTDNAIKGVFIISDEGVKHELVATIDRPVCCGKGSIKLSIFDRDADSIRNTFGKSGINLSDKKEIGLRDARNFLNELSGIAIYRDDFRVRPYGDKDADWLNLDKRRVQNPSLRLEQAQISGIILIDDEESSGLIERSSREGFEHNDSYLSLKLLLLKLLKKIEEIRYNYNQKVGKNRDSQGDKVSSAFNKLQHEVSLKKIENFSDYLTDDKKEEFNKVVYEHKTTLESLIKIIKERQAMLEGRSTLGFIMAEVLHEARHHTSSLGGRLNSLSKRLKKKWSNDITPEVLDELQNSINDGINNIRGLENLYRRLNPLIRVRNGKKYDFFVGEVIKKAILVYEHKLNELGVNIDLQTSDEQYVINGLEGDLTTAIINLIDNSLYWFEARKIKEPIIKIFIQKVEELIFITIEDNAGGVSDKFKDSIFNVGFTSKENGSGLGLSIARESLGRMGAYITHENTLSGSVFKIGAKEDI